MRHLELTDEECRTLREVLDQHHIELLREIDHTDNRAFRDALRRRDDLLERLIDRLTPIETG